jgi:RHS repeat-associated protein
MSKISIMAPDGTILASSAVGNPYLYTGRRLDPESGNYHFRSRIYSPDLGRFLQMDPLGYIDGLNSYASYFVINDIDPYGTFSFFDMINSLTGGLPDIDVSAGISFEAKSPPVFGPVGLMIKLETKFTYGTCCQKGKIKNYVKHDVSVQAGVHVGTPGYSVQVALQANASRSACPKTGDFKCQGVISAKVTILHLSYGCSKTWDGKWSCGMSGRLSGFSDGTSGPSGSYGISGTI